MTPHPCFSALVSACLATPIAAGPADHHLCRPSGTAPPVVVLNDNGAWSWFQDERVVVDETTETLLVSSAANAHGTDGARRDGNIEVASYQLTTGITHRAVLHPHLQADDHDSASLYVRPDGRYVAMYSSHASDPFSRWRVTRQPGDIDSWEPETRLNNGAVVTYSNMYAGFDGRAQHVLYSFVRSVGRDPHLLLSSDDGKTWSLGGRLLDGPGRPYLRYVADQAQRIHLIATEQHPDDYPNGIYHGVVANQQLLRTDGTVVDADLSDEAAVTPRQLTTVFAGGFADHAWTIDIQVDQRGNPYIAFSVHSRPDSLSAPATTTHGRYYYARYDGAAWHVHPVASAGSALSRQEPFYSGLVALDPRHPGRLFISTDIDPRTDTPLISTRDHKRHHEIFEGETHDGGTTWSWRPITADSTVDNIRPVIPAWNSQRTALVWLRGTYTTYRNYDLDVVALVLNDEPHTTAPCATMAGPS